VGYDKSQSRLFWKNSQGGNAQAATSDGTTRLRTDGVAISSVDTAQDTSFSEVLSSSFSTARKLISSSAEFVSAAFVYASGTATRGARAGGSHPHTTHFGAINGNFGTGLGPDTGSYSINAATTSFDLGLQGLIVEYLSNGVVVNRYQTLNDEPLAGVITGTLFQLDSYQPYQISLLSSWPLDPRNDIYDSTKYLTSSLGGKGLQIGLTPHRNNSLTTVGSSTTALSGSEPETTGSVITTTADALTASAGELVYSTKPTIFFWRNSDVHQSSSIILSASSTTASHLFHDAGLLSRAPVEKFELEDAQGHRVGFHFVTGSEVCDGSLVEASGSVFVAIGINQDQMRHVDDDSGLSTQELYYRIASAVNAVNHNPYRYGQYLNITASWVPGEDQPGVGVSGTTTQVEFIQTTPGTGLSPRLVTSSWWTTPEITALYHSGACHYSPSPKYDLGHGNSTSIANGHPVAQYFHPTENFQGDGVGVRGARIENVPNDDGYHFVTSSLADDAIQGYKAPTASLQYNRHTFPYNTPFYATNRVRQRSPSYNLYSDYANNFKYLGRDYSFIPEFRYSDHLEHYHKKYSSKLKSNNFVFVRSKAEGLDGDLWMWKRNVNLFMPLSEILISNQKANFLTLEGGDVTSSASGTLWAETPTSHTRYEYDDIAGAQLVDIESGDTKGRASHLSDQQSVNFYGKYGITDSTINFSHLLDQDGDGFVQDVNTVPTSVTFKSSAVKKLLPYNGFYPVLRTVQIGNALKKEFTGASGYTGSMDRFPRGSGPHEDAYLQAALEPFMAPGILYNSIKSGIGVEYPIYTSKPNYYFPNDFVTIPDGKYEQNTIYGLQPHAISSSYHGGLSMMGAARCFPSIMTSLPDIRLPFKSIYDIDTMKNIFAPQEGARPFRSFSFLIFVDMDRFGAGYSGPRWGWHSCDHSMEGPVL
jgi:hypothetical protein